MSEATRRRWRLFRRDKVAKEAEPSRGIVTTPAELPPFGLKVEVEGQDPNVDIIVVHGLNGHREETWTAANGVHWPRDLLPSEIPNARVLSWGYDSTTHGDRVSCMYLYDHARQLVSDLCLERSLTQTLTRPIIFVAHSLGGIVVKSALIHADAARHGALKDHQSIKTSTYGIIFMGTPHQGGSGVQLGKLLLNVASVFIAADTRLLQHLERDSEYLQQQLGQYGPISGDFVTKFAYEVYETRTAIGHSLMVVPRASAVVPGAIDAEPIAIHADHINMVKFASKDDGGYKTVVGQLRLMAQDANDKVAAQWEIERRVDVARLRSEEKAPQHSTLLHLSPTTRLASPTSPISLTTSEQTYVHLFDQRSPPDVIGYPAQGTCRWSTETSEYKAWTLANESSILWLTGHAGSGKTTLTNFLIEYLQQTLDGKSGYDGAVYYCFCTRNDEAFRDARSLLRNLIVQILRSKREIINKIRRKFHTDKQQIDHSFNFLWTVFQTALANTSYKHVYIVIDAIDECNSLRKELLERIFHSLSVHSTTDERAPVVKYLISCQSTAYRLSWLNGPHIKHLHLEIEVRPELANDLEQYLKIRTQALVEDEICSPESAALLQGRLAKLAGSSFLWLQVTLDNIEQSPMPRYAEHDFERFITDLPVTLSDAYTKYLSEVQDKGLALLKKFLPLMVVSARPLTLFEIDAFTDLKGHPMGLQLGPQQVNGTKDSLKKAFGPLIRFPHMTARFIHPSVIEYLLSIQSTPQHPLYQTHKIAPEAAHGFCAVACIHYLRDQRIAKNLFAPQSPTQTSPTDSLEAARWLQDRESGSFSGDDGSAGLCGMDDLFDIADVGFLQSEEVVIERCCEDIRRHQLAFDYAASNWTYHYARCDQATADALEADSVALLSLETEALSNWYRYQVHQARTDMPSTHNALVLAAFFDLPRVVRSLLRRERPSPNEVRLHDALYWASFTGSKDCVAMLLEAGVPTHEPGSAKVPLVVATRGGFLDVCNLLLCMSDIDPNCCDESGQPPLTIAAKQDRADILTALLVHQHILCNKKDAGGRTALAEACRCSALDSIGVLLKDSRVDINARDNRGRTAFHHACTVGEDRVLKRLLAETDIDIAAKDNFGRNAASLAAESGHLRVIKRLHHKGADIECKDKTGRNAISWAANQGKASDRSQGTESVLEFVARKYPHCLDDPDEDGWSPLAWALDPPGFTEAVRVLVKSGHANINRRDNSGRSILSWAAGEGFVDIVKILLAAPGIQKNSPSPGGGCPLISAAAGGRTAVVKLLLDDPEVDVFIRDDSGRNPMDWAKLNNHAEVVALLQSCQ